MDKNAGEKMSGKENPEETEIIKNLIAAYENRIKTLASVRDISLKIKFHLEEEIYYGEEDEINALLDKRDLEISNNRDCALTVKHYKSKLPAKIAATLDAMEKGESNKNEEILKNLPFFESVDKILKGEKEIRESIKKLDSENIEKTKKMMADVKKKMDAVKNNRILMDKFIDSGGEKSGTLFRQKK